MQVLVSDSIAREGIEILQRHARVVMDDKITTDALLLAIPEYDALVVRSRTKVIAPIIEAGTRLRVIGRAGVGLDNIDTEAAAPPPFEVITGVLSLTAVTVTEIA